MEQDPEELEPTPGLAVLSGLSRANARVPQAVDAVLTRARTDLAGLPPSAAAMLLARAAKRAKAPFLVIVADVDAARRTAADLTFFLGSESETDGDATDGEGVSDRGGARVLVYPGGDVTPFADVAPDRRAAMERLAALFHLAQGLPFEFVVAPIAALARRVPPKASLVERSMVVRAEDELDRERLIRVMTEGGYLRVPVVEDPGTFAVRGSIIDVFPPHSRHPARIELDDWLVTSIKLFEPEDQRTVGTIDRIFVHPARQELMGPEEMALARTRVRDLCDAIDMPTRNTRQLIDDLESGRTFLGIEGFLPAFYEKLDTLFDYLPAGTSSVVVDPSAVTRAMREEMEAADADRSAKVASRAPAFPMDALYAGEAELASCITSTRVAIVHRVAALGAPEEGESPLAALESVKSADEVLDLGAEDQTPLTTELSQRRQGQGRDDALRPLATRTRAWLDAGMRVLMAARTRTQADRLASLLRGYEIPIAGKPAPFAPSMLEGKTPRATEIVIGGVGGGFVVATEALALVTEEEIFGTRAHRRREVAGKKKRRSSDAFVEDLRQLQPGDYVVHVDHGVGKYLGLEKKTLGLTKGEELRGVSATSVEVLVVEYAGGDRLFLPVTRLHQIQKFAGGEGATPKMDRLGGQTFAKTKAKVKKHVQEMADELLRLYAQRAATKRNALAPADRTYAEFEATFPFDETADQMKAIEDVLSDLERGHPMDRIVCGDVGFGKTEVAIRAAFRVALTGRQVAVLCPTTVLAQQHYQTFAARMRQYPVRIEVLSRFVDSKDQAKILADIKEGKVDIVVGTHRLLSKDIHFKDLGLLVVDEEQRFGVTHKERIKKLRTEVDVLTLTATPIPRTLQLAVGGLRDLSLITTPPADRRAVRTFVTRWDDHLLKEAIQRELARGGQCFFVYNRIEGLYERAQKLQQLVPDARFAVAHGQMGEAALEQTMTDFVAGRFDILCATAIIESGLDIPRANTILIDRADTFGLAQLYQLRGRVGRSRERAYCYLVTPPPNAMTDEARARIEALERFSELGSGFQVASLDMELRGAGDVLGAEQSGNLAAVGFDLFLHMLEDAVAQLRGEPIVHEVDTEITLDEPLYLPDDYVSDVGLRLSFYKRFANAESESEVSELASEMEDRFGPPPPAALTFVRAMGLRTVLRALRVLGCEANRERVTLHLREDTPLDPAKVMAKVGLPRSPWRLSPDMKLTKRFGVELAGDALDRVEQVLRDVEEMKKAS
ncbi:transcription-repair coupling factor [Sandaracinus amylolyticus]|uniref:Transcription-repair-coupling factor n=1 Tax=Sandaracinus amylolyticus TaxID=927083 RepID=A0A0F6W5D0_9BACT|nr:transcription-repair coupling factor [Sandaracinus amylolyticus]AKF07900.1 Transcription-repair coupling factor [Sandaracinus amylolyticus]